MEYITQYTEVKKAELFVKYGRKATFARALLVVLLKSGCNFNAPKICGILGNITQANVSRLAGIGMRLLETNVRFRLLFEVGVRMPDVI